MILQEKDEGQRREQTRTCFVGLWLLPADAGVLLGRQSRQAGSIFVGPTLGSASGRGKPTALQIPTLSIPPHTQGAPRFEDFHRHENVSIREKRRPQRRHAINLRARWAERHAGLDSCGTARRAINMGSPGMAVPLSGIVFSKAEAVRCKLSVGREVKTEFRLPSPDSEPCAVLLSSAARY